MPMKNSGFTLIELLMVVIIIGVLITLAVPNYLRSVERGKGGKAKDNVIAIRMTESYYRALNDTYTNSVANLTDYGLPVAPILNDPDWSYLVPVATADSLVVSAIRINGPYQGEGIAVTQEGKVSFSSSSVPW